MEARVDGANAVVYISTSGAFTHHFRHHGSFVVALFLYKLQVADAPNSHQLQVFSLLGACAADLCDAHDHQVRQDCDSSPDNKESCRSSSPELAFNSLGPGVAPSSACAYALLPVLFSFHVVATNLGVIILCILVHSP